MGAFNPQRLTIARKRRRLTAKALAGLIGSSPVTISRLENGNNEPEEQTLDAIAKVLEFPRAFFLGDDCDELTTEAASFRSLAAMSAKERDAALSAGALAYLFSDWVAQRFNLPEPALLDLSFEPDPEGAAQALRQEWNLGQQPVSNLIRLLESKGVRVFSLAENTRNVDAFSCWRDSYPYVFLNTFKSTEHSRFDAAHELGHLVLHKMCRLTDWQYRGFCIEMNRRDYRTQEPETLPPERSVIWQKVLSALWKDRITKDDIAADLQIPTAELENFLFGLTGEPERASGSDKLPLRLVSTE